MKDVSTGGACVVGLDPKATPETITLVFWERGQVKRRCQVIWRGETEIGVRYLRGRGKGA
jgi:hypothetical protein